MLDELFNLCRYGVYATESSINAKYKYEIYVVLTDTKTLFSRLSKVVTRQPYNHVSLALDEDFSELYTFALTTGNSSLGGFKVETRQELEGMRYLAYKVSVTKHDWTRISNHIKSMVENPLGTTYNRFGLINLIFDLDVFKNSDKSRAICSEFVANLLSDSGAEFIEGKKNHMLKPYDLLKNKRLEFFKRGVL